MACKTMESDPPHQWEHPVVRTFVLNSDTQPRPRVVYSAMEAVVRGVFVVPRSPLPTGERQREEQRRAASVFQGS